MSIRFYVDEHVPRAITEVVSLRSVDILTVQADDSGGSDDVAGLNRAMQLNRVVLTNDDDFLIEAALRQRTGEQFAGVIFVDLNRLTIGHCIGDLELIGRVGEPADFINRVEYLPL